MTLAERFIAKAQHLMPHIGELADLDPTIDEASRIDEIMFHKGEYIGGMAAVILTLVRSDAKKADSPGPASSDPAA